VQHFWNIADPIARAGVFLSWLEAQSDAEHQRMIARGVYSEETGRAEIVLREALEAWIETVTVGADAVEAIHARIESSRWWLRELETAAKLAAEAFLVLEPESAAAIVLTAPFDSETAHRSTPNGSR
jgi:hypothetical protein